MLEDLVCKDRVIIDISEPKRCDEFRSSIKDTVPEGVDKKQAVVDAAMAMLDAMHDGVQRTLKA